ncbi:MAG TPA: GGDEF domain-containing protein [Solirubrobacterales bacterium]|nr:GGDEF domain-containing protein [Solirubrobacterales bacterium]
MSPAPLPNEPPDRDPVAAGVLVAGLVAIGAGLLAPLLSGSFSRGETLVLVLVELLCLLAVAAGVVLLSRRLRASHDALWALARCDELTGVGNYRALQERLAEEVARHRRHGRELALILLDLDGFKQVNERYGHLRGDGLLAEIGAVLRETVRAEDAVFRQGGDEFAVILPETGAEEAEEVAARLRERVRLLGSAIETGTGVTISTGLALFPADGADNESLLGVADSDLFAFKRRCRDRAA